MVIFGAVGWPVPGGQRRFMRAGVCGARPELADDPAKGTVDLGTGINHLVIQVESLDATLADLAVKGIAAGPAADPGHPDAPRTSWITDPDGYRIELAQWPTGHADGITEADFPEPTDPARLPAAPCQPTPGPVTEAPLPQDGAASTHSRAASGATPRTKVMPPSGRTD
jgi:lactoylglutathione lyase